MLSNREQPGLVEEFTVVANPGDNGGEQISVTVEVFDNSDYEDNMYTSQTISLQSYGSEAKIVTSVITPEFLREVADKMEAAIKKHRRKHGIKA
jgi:hypothetical protein